MKILVINSGSSSVKYQLFSTKLSYPLCKGILERIGSKKSTLTHHKHNKKPASQDIRVPNHHEAMKYIFQMLTAKGCGVIKSYKEISGIGHRVVHGADVFNQPTLINKKVIETIERFNELAPLHNPPALLGIRACMQHAKDIPQIAVFDTAFHQTIPSKSYIYGIPYEFYKDLKVRRYGFHGTSHKYVAEHASRQLKRSEKKLKLITCHLGNGCSITAVNKGKSVDTSMGLTPLEGLLMGTRCGDIDPAVVLYIMEKKSLGIKGTDNLLNKKSGILGLSGISNDMRDIAKAVKSKNKRAELAMEVFLYRIEKYIGAYTAAMDGLDAVVLTAGIGENMPYIKRRLLKDMKGFLSRFKAKILVIPTNEELMIAREAAGVLSKSKR